MTDFLELDFIGVETKKSGDAIAMRYSIAGVPIIHVVDGGYAETGVTLCKHIRDHFGNPRRIDHVVATHNDHDHTRGLQEVLSSFEVGNLWMLRPWVYAEELLPRFSTYSSVDRLRSRLKSAYENLWNLNEIALERGITVRDPFQGATIGGFRVLAPTKSRFLDLIVESEKTPQAEAIPTQSLLGEFLSKASNVVSYIAAGWGAETFPRDGTSAENEMSVVQYGYFCGKKVLLTADTGRAGLEEAINYSVHAGLALPGLDYVQIPHHGGRRNVNSELLDRLLGPRLGSRPASGHFCAVISSAKADPDHPKRVVQRAVIHRGANLYSLEGRTLSFKLGAAPQREGWTSADIDDYPTTEEA